MLRALTSVFLICACSSSGQVTNNPHPAAAFPGDWLQFRSDRKLTGRSRLVGGILLPAVTSASVGIPRRETLPTVSYSSAIVNLHTNRFVNNGQALGDQHADVVFQNIRTSDGYALPTFGFYFGHTTGTTKLDLQFAGANDQSLQNIPGLTQNIFFSADPSTRATSISDVSSLSVPLQRLMFAIAANLASIYQNASRVDMPPNASGFPVWSLNDVIGFATPFTDLLFQPSPILWSQFIGARQTSVAFQAAAGAASTINLPAANSNAGALAANATWGIGPPTYDLNHNGNPITLWIDVGEKIGNFVDGSTAFQKVRFDSAFGTCGGDPSGCTNLPRGYLYQWQNGNWVEQWRTDPFPILFEPQTIVGDFDGDGRLEVAVEPWYNVQVFDLLTGALKYTAQFTPEGAQSGRGYGWFGAFDLNGDGKQEFVALGDFQNLIAVMGWKNGQLVKLWDHLIEAHLDDHRTVHVPGAYPVQDIDGDGKLDVVTSLYNETGDGQWHVVARDGMTGTVLLDQPQRFLVGMADVNGDGAAEMFTITTKGLLVPEYGQVDVVNFRSRTLKTLLDLSGVGLATQPVERLPLNINTWVQLAAPVAGPIANGGLPVFFTRRVVDASKGTIELTPWQWSNGAFAKLGTITGPNLRVLATRAAAAGSPGFQVTAAASGNGAGSITVSGASGTVVQSSLIPAPLSSVAVGHLRPGDPPTVVVQNALEELVAFRPSSATGGATVVWTHPGRGGTTGNPEGQYGFSGPLLASLTGDGTLQTIAFTRGPAGQARVVAIQPDGRDLWTSDLDRFPGAPPPWNAPGATLAFAGRLRNPNHEDVVAFTRRGGTGSEELNLLDGLTGQLVWTDSYGPPAASLLPGSNGPGGGWVSIYDWNHDGLDEIVNEMTYIFWVKNGQDQNLITRTFNPAFSPVFPSFSKQANGGVPVVADFLNNGTDTILFGGSTSALGLLDPNANAIWYTTWMPGTPGYLQGIADLDGDGTLSLVSAGAGPPSGPSTLRVQRSSTGELLWSIPLPECGTFAAGGSPYPAPTPVTVGDINGDGRDEAIFACGSKIYVTGANPGNRSGKILWSLDLGTMLDTPILADAEGNGRLEIVVVGANGYVYGIGSQPGTAAAAANAPSIPTNGVVEGATFRPGQIAPGGWFTIQGTNLSDGKYQAAATPLPQQLGGTVVTVNGQIARLNYVDTGQINAEMPPDMPVGPASVVVRTKAGSSRSATVQIVPAMPQIFQYGVNRAVAQNVPDYRLNGPDNAIPAGASLVVYFTGGGLVNGDRRTGVPAPLTILMQTKLATTVMIGGQPAQLAFSGLTPGSIGLYQANVTVPASLSPGDYPVTISVGGVTSSPALMSVK